jgi:hypothetical protein
MPILSFPTDSRIVDAGSENASSIILCGTLNGVPAKVSGANLVTGALPDIESILSRLDALEESQELSAGIIESMRGYCAMDAYGVGVRDGVGAAITVLPGRGIGSIGGKLISLDAELSLLLSESAKWVGGLSAGWWYVWVGLISDEVELRAQKAAGMPSDLDDGVMVCPVFIWNAGAYAAGFTLRSGVYRGYMHDPGQAQSYVIPSNDVHSFDFSGLPHANGVTCRFWVSGETTACSLTQFGDALAYREADLLAPGEIFLASSYDYNRIIAESNSSGIVSVRNHTGTAHTFGAWGLDMVMPRTLRT